jgi:hypothetical protein
MSTNLEDHDAGLARYYGMLTGTVADNVDPKGLHRVCVLIPGIADPQTDWLFPLTSGGGSPERGGHVVPDIGADVAVWFKQGDPQSMGCYACGWWGEPDAGAEVPFDAKQAGPSAHLVQTLRIGRIIATVDETPGAESFKLYDALGAFSFQVDLVRKVAHLLGLVGLRLESKGQVDVVGLEVTVKGRRVTDTSSPL